MFAYCGNNPVNRADSSGMFWKEIGNFFKKVGTVIADFAKATFGAGITTVHKVKQETEILPPVVNAFGFSADISQFKVVLRVLLL